MVKQWIFSYFTNWIQAFRANEGEMNHIWWIAVQEFALFTFTAFLEKAKFRIERNETYDPGLSITFLFGSMRVFLSLSRVSFRK